MCGVSGIELVILLVIALVVIGPERLPEAMSGLGKLMRQIREIASDLTAVKDEIVESIPVADMKKQLKKELAIDQMNDATKSVNSEIDAIRSRMRKVKVTENSLEHVPSERISNAPTNSLSKTSEDNEETSNEETNNEETNEEMNDEETDGKTSSGKDNRKNDENLSELDKIRARIRAQKHEQTKQDTASEQISNAPKGSEKLSTKPKESSSESVESVENNEIPLSKTQQTRRAGMGASIRVGRKSVVKEDKS